MNCSVLKWIGRVLALIMIAGLFVTGYNAEWVSWIDPEYSSVSIFKMIVGGSEILGSGVGFFIIVMAIPVIMLIMYFLSNRAKIAIGVVTMILAIIDAILWFIINTAMAIAGFEGTIGYYMNIIPLALAFVLSILILASRKEPKASAAPMGGYNMPPMGGYMPQDNGYGRMPQAAPQNYGQPMQGGAYQAPFQPTPPTPPIAPQSADPVTSEGWTCPNCGTQNGEEFRFCMGCGNAKPEGTPEPEPEAEAEPEVAAQAFCTNCGAPIAPGSAFCPNCGAKQ